MQDTTASVCNVVMLLWFMNDLGFAVLNMEKKPSAPSGGAA